MDASQEARTKDGTAKVLCLTLANAAKGAAVALGRYFGGDSEDFALLDESNARDCVRNSLGEATAWYIAEGADPVGYLRSRTFSNLPIEELATRGAAATALAQIADVASKLEVDLCTVDADPRFGLCGPDQTYLLAPKGNGAALDEHPPTLGPRSKAWRMARADAVARRAGTLARFRIVDLSAQNDEPR